jgi:hypothetical protein
MLGGKQLNVASTKRRPQQPGDGIVVGIITGYQEVQQNYQRRQTDARPHSEGQRKAKMMEGEDQYTAPDEADQADQGQA